jgi:SAM-dependent methyltransferase
MFSIEFLHDIREYEIDKITEYLPPGARILELGGGTGYQAKALAARGFKVTSIDVPSSLYSEDKIFPVVEYDGRIFPFKDGTFDIVFSSNVLEHIPDLQQIHKETERVLKGSGYCVHVMPTAVWRFWTLFANYIEMMQLWWSLVPGLVPRRMTQSELVRVAHSILKVVKIGARYIIPRRHGETGNAIAELWTFSRVYWLRHFQKHNFEVVAAEPIGLFYTGHFVLGRLWPLKNRSRVASFLGSACVIYQMKANRSCEQQVPKVAVHRPKRRSAVQAVRMRKFSTWR